MLDNILLTIIRETFLRESGKRSEETWFRVEFETPVDYDKEEGYRQVEMVLYAPHNYVQVWVRTKWDVVPVEGIEYDESGYNSLKEGFDYNKGASEWQMIANHDSCWTDGVSDVIRGKFGKIEHLNTIGQDSWYTRLDEAPEGLPVKK